MKFLIIVLYIIGYSKNILAENLKTKTLVQADDVVWGFDFLPDQKIIFTERHGKIKIFDLKTQKVTELKLDLKVVNKGQGGLLDIRVGPNFKENQFIYFTYSKQVGDLYTTALGRFKLQDSKVKELGDLFVSNALSKNTIHYGSRIEFSSENELFISIGDRNEREKAQDPKLHFGKILRLDKNGKPLDENPVWSLGHRNPQGLVFDTENKILYESEFGPRGGDELNVIKMGKNYGWPVITYGREYWGPKIGEGTAKPGMEQPLVYWVPSISPSAITIYNRDHFKNWKGNIFLACLSGEHLRRLVLKEGKVESQEEIFKNKNWRIRNVRVGLEGYIYISTDQGQIISVF